MKDEIVKLSETYMNMVSGDHHKDRDCHWYINTVYSYGNEPVFRIEHNGYIFDPEPQAYKEFDTYEQAEKGLLDLIQRAVDDQVEWATNVLKDPLKWEKYQVKHAEQIIRLTP